MSNFIIGSVRRSHKCPLIVLNGDYNLKILNKLRRI